MPELTSTAQPEQSLHLLLTGMVQALCDQPDLAAIEAERDGDEVTFHVTAPEAEAGRLLGKGGRTARSLRTIVGAAAGRSALRCTIDIHTAE